MKNCVEDPFAYVRQYAYSGPDTIIRRYLQLDKFLDLARTGELYFAPASAMSDPEEGYFTLADQRAREENLQTMGFPARGLNIARKAWDTIAAGSAKTVVLSCWTMGRAEDPRMWHEYAPSSDAVALETTVHALQRALSPEFLAVPVRYMDRENELLPNSTLDTLEPYFFKGKHFEWERELRFVGNMEMGRQLGSPRRIKVHPGRAHFRFIVAPSAPVGRLEQVRTLLAHWEPGVKVRASSLARAATACDKVLATLRRYASRLGLNLGSCCRGPD